MCLIIKKPEGRQISADFLENAWQRNSDGWGCFHIDAGQPVWIKGMNLAGLLQHNQSLPLGCEVYLHLRKATYGHVTPDMAHPYPVRPGLLLMHNGSIDHLAPTDPSRSDTAELARFLHNMLDGLSDAQAARLLRSEGFARLLAPLIKGSMIVLLDAQGAVRLGRDWHVVQAREWDGVMPGIEVSNTHAWAPRCAEVQAAAGNAWQKLQRLWAGKALPRQSSVRA